MIKLFGSKKDGDSEAERRKRAEALSGRAIKYVTERDAAAGADVVIGKAGSLSVRQGQLIVLSSQKIVFRCAVEKLKISELMSLEGVILEGPDQEQGGRVRKVIAYYTYYRS